MVQLLKVHGSLNQFLLLDQALLQQPLTTQELQLLVQTLTQIPALQPVDGLLVVNQATDPKALGQMQIFNADGSKALMCGNGLRTVARYLADKFQQDDFTVETPQKSLHVKRYPNLAPQVPAFGVEISPVSFAPQTVGLTTPKDPVINQIIPTIDPDLKFTALAVPNPHLITFVPEIDTSRLQQLGQQLNDHHSELPDGVNLSFVKILASQEIFVQTFERGVGLTNACGTAMSAASLALVLNYPQKAQFEQLLQVYNPGGMVRTKVHHPAEADQYWMELIGNATIMGRTQLPEVWLHQPQITDKISFQTNSESTAYHNWTQQLMH